jgi:hypothetical protein
VGRLKASRASLIVHLVTSTQSGDLDNRLAIANQGTEDLLRLNLGLALLILRVLPKLELNLRGERDRS